MSSGSIISASFMLLAHNNRESRSIVERLAYINSRSEIGHHEMDTGLVLPVPAKCCSSARSALRVLSI